MALKKVRIVTKIIIISNCFLILADESADILTLNSYLFVLGPEIFLGPFPWKKLGGPTYGFHLKSEKTGGARAPPAP